MRFRITLGTISRRVMVLSFLGLDLLLVYNSVMSQFGAVPGE